MRRRRSEDVREAVEKGIGSRVTELEIRSLADVKRRLDAGGLTRADCYQLLRNIRNNRHAAYEANWRQVRCYDTPREHFENR